MISQKPREINVSRMREQSAVPITSKIKLEKEHKNAVAWMPLRNLPRAVLANPSLSK